MTIKLSEIERKIFQFIKDYEIFKKCDKILIGVSGGKDSMTLLNIMYKLSKLSGYQLGVAHFNHKLRKESDKEQEFVRSYCEGLSVPFFTAEGDVIGYCSKNKKTIETGARELRYEFLYEILRKYGYNKIATAHHASDLAETVIYRLSRGTGIIGMGGLSPVNGKVTHPMLTVTLKEILDYVTINNVKHVNDSSNEDKKYTRNAIRLDILPVLENINPKYDENILRFCQIVWSYKEQVEKIYDERVSETGEVYEFKLRYDFFDSEVLRMIFLKNGKYPPNYEESCKIISMKNGGRRKFGNIVIKRKKDSLTLQVMKQREA
ncbi:MAG TPA: tRNA lysidine(34) synthetase TilS [Petrotogaceae bacterium]|nr:tRNA lysidine(34) synthetase TilS [Petrotogaceae bacterium]